MRESPSHCLLRDNMMDKKEIRKIILRDLYAAFEEQDGVGYISMGEIAEKSGIDIKAIEKQTDFLEELGYARYEATGGIIGITPKGINFIEGPSEFNPLTQFTQQSIEIHGGSVGQIIQAHIINNPSLFLNRLVEELDNHPDIPPEKKAAWRKTLSDLSNNPAAVEIIRGLFVTLGG